MEEKRTLVVWQTWWQEGRHIDILDIDVPGQWRRTPHTAQCVKWSEEYKKRKEEYEAAWPNYCRKCNGAGGFEYSENQAPLGSGHVWLQYGTEPCIVCEDLGLCSRCGKPMDAACFEDMLPCPSCGWNWGQNPGDLLGDPPECYCWESLNEDGTPRKEWRDE